MFRRGSPVNARVVGALLMAVLLASLVFAFVSHRGLPGRSYNYATAAFDFLPPGLREGSDVRVLGVRVGQIHDIVYEDEEARVEMQLPGSLDVYRDASARIRSRSLLGQKYVEIDPGTEGAGHLGEGAISRERTRGLIEVDQAVESLDAPSREALGAVLRELGTGVSGRGEDLNDLIAASPDMLADLGSTAGALSQEEARLAAFLIASERLSQRFEGREAELEALVGQLGRTFEAIAVDGGEPLRQTVERLPGTLEAATPVLSQLSQTFAALSGAVGDFGPAATALGVATPDLRAALRESVPPLGRFPAVNRLADPALGSLTTTMSDARPLAPAVRRGFGLLAPPLEVLAPYATELNLFADNLRDAFSQGDANGNFLRILGIIVGADNYTGVIPADNPAVRRDPYPAPGQAAQDGKS
jgi:phospholipid/cholesterol/gamma-HCH transport system substrate-binding protein